LSTTPTPAPTPPATPARVRRRRHPPLHSEGLVLLRSLLEVVVSAIFIMTFIVQPIRIPSESMEPTLFVGDFGLADKQSFAAEGPLAHLLPPSRIERGDLVIFHYPVDPHRYLVKRTVGLPGDRLRLRGGHVWVNGWPVYEPYAFYSVSPPNAFRDEFPTVRETRPALRRPWAAQLQRATRDDELIVPPDQYFVLGDNRNDSEDSRFWGFVPRSAIVGRPLLVYFTLHRPEEREGPLPLRERLLDELSQVRILR
jgi:signal peptidase I